MSGRAVFVHDLALEEYGFGGEHPFNPLRVRLTVELCEALGLLEGFPFVGPEPATDEDLTTVHSLSYVRSVQKAGRGGTAGGGRAASCRSWRTASVRTTLRSFRTSAGHARRWGGP